MHLLDGNVLYALIDESHVHHAPARRWFASFPDGFATCPITTCPITQGTFLRLVMRLGGHGVEQALALLNVVTAHARHHFWPDVLPYDHVQWRGVMGHRQVTDAYLARGWSPCTRTSRSRCRRSGAAGQRRRSRVGSVANIIRIQRDKRRR